MESVGSEDGEEERDSKMNPQEFLIWQEWKKKKQQPYYLQVKGSVEVVQVETYGNLEWKWGLKASLSICCDSSGVCLNVLTRDILKRGYHLWPKLGEYQYEQMCPPEFMRMS